MANKDLKIKQYTRIIECIANKYKVSLDEALKMFYHSKAYVCLDSQIGDYHCQGDLYIAEDIIDEYKKSGI